MTTCLPLVMQVLTMLAATPYPMFTTPLPAEYQPTLAPSAVRASCEDMSEALLFFHRPKDFQDGEDVVAVGLNPTDGGSAFLISKFQHHRPDDWGRPLVVCGTRDWPDAPAMWRLTLLLGQQADGKKCWGREGDAPVS